MQGSQMRAHSLGAIVLLAALVLPSSVALAWGESGHRIVCEIAYQELSEPARSKLGQILSADASASGLSTKNFAASCIFPDQPPKQRSSDHFINVPRNTPSIATP